MTDTLDELLVGLGFEEDTKDLENFKNDIQKTVGFVKELAKYAALAATALTGLTVTTARNSDSQGKFASKINDTVDNIDALGFASQIAGESVDGINSSLEGLSRVAAEAARGTGSGVEVFGMLGISVTDLNGQLKSSSDLLMEVSDSIQGLDRGRQLEFLDKLGLGGSALLLQQGSRNIQELMEQAKELGVITEEDAAISAEFNDSLVELWQIIKQVSRLITKELAPYLTQVKDLIVEWWSSNRELIEQRFPKWIEDLTHAIKLLGAAIALLIGAKVVVWLTTVISKIKAASLAMLFLNASVAALPVAIALAIGALAALADDAKGYFEGEDSLLGKFMEDFPEFRNDLQIIASVMATMYDLTMKIFEGWDKIFKLFSGEIDLSFLGRFLLDEVLPSISPSAAAGLQQILNTSNSTDNSKRVVVENINVTPSGGVTTAESRRLGETVGEALEDFLSSVVQ